MCDVSVIIATFDRPVLLERALRSVAAQQCPEDLEFEIIIVDNTSTRSAETNVNRLISELRVSTIYLNEPRQNISLARNAGIAASRGALIAFLDDDEEAPPDWLSHLVATQRKFRADVVFGPVIPAFEGGAPPAWDPKASLYLRDTRLRTGTAVSLGGTGNALINAALLVGKENFDPAFGLTGGGDTDFFQRLGQLGAQFVWCAEAHVTEFLPLNRCNRAYLMRRAFKSNQSYVRCCRKNSTHRTLTSAYWFANGCAQAIVLALPVLGLSYSESLVAVRLRSRFIGALGMIFAFQIFAYDFYGDSKNQVESPL